MVHVQRFELDVLSHRSVLLQVVGVCHQRGCDVVSLRYDQGSPEPPGDQAADRIALAVSGETPRVERLGHWLARLVHVLDVTAVDVTAADVMAESATTPARMSLTTG